MPQNRLKFKGPPALLLTAILMCPVLVATAAPKDAAWRREKATLIFEDAFHLEEPWNRATANRVPHIHRTDIGKCVLASASATKLGPVQAGNWDRQDCKLSGCVGEPLLPGRAMGVDEINALFESGNHCR